MRFPPSDTPFAQVQAPGLGCGTVHRALSVPRANTFKRPLTSTATSGSLVITWPGPTGAQAAPVQLPGLGCAMVHRALSVPRAKTFMRPAPVHGEPAASFGSLVITWPGASGAQAAPVQLPGLGCAMCHRALLVPRATTSRRPEPSSATSGSLVITRPGATGAHFAPVQLPGLGCAMCHRA